MYAHATIQDRNKAVADLTQLQMHPRDTIVMFVAKFRKAVKAIADVSMGIPMPSDQELVNLFIQKCLEVVPEGTDIRSSLLDYQRAIKFNGNNPILPFTLSQVEHDLTQQENNKKKIIRAQPSTRPNHRPREQANATNIREQANAADTTKNTKFRKSVRCLKCNGLHRIFDCRKATDEEKRDLWAKFKAKRNQNRSTPLVQSANNASSNSNTSQQQANSATTETTVATRSSKQQLVTRKPQNSSSQRNYDSTVQENPSY